LRSMIDWFNTISICRTKTSSTVVASAPRRLRRSAPVGRRGTRACRGARRLWLAAPGTEAPPDPEGRSMNGIDTLDLPKGYAGRRCFNWAANGVDFFITALM
jgi:hypothetical protein